MKTACREFRTKWEDLRGRIPDDASGDALKAHLASCRSCAAHAAGQAALIASLAPLAGARRAAVPPPGLSDRIVARIQREAVETSARATVPFFLRASTRRYAPLAAGLAVFLAFGLVAGLGAGGLLSGPSTPAAWPTEAGKGIFDAATGQPSNGQTGTPDSLTPSSESIEGKYPILVSIDVRSTLVNDTKAAPLAPFPYEKAVGSGAFDGAYAFRAYLQADGSLTLLALLPDKGIQDRADRLSGALSSCASPFRIEIIDPKDIGGAFQAMGIADPDAFLSSAAGASVRLLRVDLGR